MSKPQIETLYFNGYEFSIVTDSEDTHIGSLPALKQSEWTLEGLIRYNSAITQFINHLALLRNGKK